jgi:hypothetical protein
VEERRERDESIISISVMRLPCLSVWRRGEEEEKKERKKNNAVCPVELST